MSKFIVYSFFLISVIGGYSCKSFKQDILFESDTDINPELFQKTLKEAEEGYRVAPMDYLAISVFTNKGEVLVDPNAEFEIGFDGLRSNGRNNNSQMNNRIGASGYNGLFNMPLMESGSNPRFYLVDANGEVNLPLIGKQKLSEKTVHEVDYILEQAYAEYYKEPYVKSQIVNKRVTILKPNGNVSLPLRNERMTLIEVLALTSESSTGNVFQSIGKARRIKLVRGGSMKVIDLTAKDNSLLLAQTIIQPNDIVYIEPRRRIAPAELTEPFRIIGTVASVVLSLFGIYQVTKGL